MDQVGILTMYKLQNIAEPGLRPKEKLVELCKAYYNERTVGVTRAYAAMSANQRIDMLVRCSKTEVPIDAEYVILEDGLQYRISLKQKHGLDCDLTLVRQEAMLDVINADETV
ncbi:MAG: hypothetical protein IKG39_07755 [Lachnospiraceae bacterium]|nr:hypothetical protein [Lachnospiraceae bacterium]